MNLKTMLTASILVLSLFSCGWKPTQEDIKVMETERSAALKAESDIQKKETELRATKAKHAKAKAKAEAAQAELERVQKELENN